jgi:hypothetical protein
MEGHSSLEGDVLFHGVMPLYVQQKATTRSILRELPLRGALNARLEVVHPYRPVPRSFYVLDDPNLAAADREMLTYLIELFTSSEESAQRINSRIVDNLRTLGLTRDFKVLQVSKRLGPKVIEIRVAPNALRQQVTIADAGFGLSQVLPLAVSDARLSRGYFVAYQPEVHLHPFAQSRLADILVNSVSRGNQIFVETHSVDLILRLQNKIASGQVRESDVGIYCFENAKGQSSIREIGFDNAGRPLATWPSGFLDTSLTLARELSASRNSRKA